MFRIFRISAMFFALTVGLTLAWAVFPVLAGPEEAVLYVAPVAGGAEDCSSWENPCTLQTALFNAVSGDQIWVQAGVHKPGTTVNDTFALVNGVAIYGGFTGTETTLDQRDWEANVTVLSGDVDNNDVTDPNGVVTDTANIAGDNAYHVVRSTGVLSNTRLDGVVVTAGQANGTYPHDSGGGMYNDNGHPLLVNVEFIANRGGGMANNYSSPTLAYVSFIKNKADNLYIGGGGMSNIYSNPSLIYVSFNNNSTRSAGGGMYNYQSHPQLTNVIFRENSAQLGGGIHNYSSHPTLINVTFESNIVSNSGGGILNNVSNPTLINTTFIGNLAINYGGGVSNSNSSPIFTNVTFWGNSAEEGGGISNSVSSRPIIANSILWANNATFISSNQIYNDASSVSIISYSDIQDSGGSGAGWDLTLGTDGGGNIDADPLFVAPLNGDLHLDLASPAVDAGNNLSVTVTTDLDGNPRLADIPIVPDTGTGTPPLVDMGAYEAQPIYSIYLPITVRDTP